MFTAKPVNKAPSVGVIDNQRGVAILVAIGVVAVLLSAGLALNQRIRSSVSDAIRVRDDLVLSEMATSGVHAAMVMLINDRKTNNTDTLQEDWANPEKVAEMMGLMPFDDGELDVRIEDERGKIQVNALVKFPEGRQFVASQRSLWERLLDRLFSLFEDPPDSDLNMIINSLKDWLDDGDNEAITGLTGAESDYYEGLEPPYSCKNGPFDHLGEVALVQGILPELYYGVGGAAGLSAMLTVYGATASGESQFAFDGKINISTADVNVLAALLPSEDDDLAQALADYRIAMADETFVNTITSANWYKQVPGAGGLTIDADLITVSSDLFRIVATAKRNRRTHILNVVVQRQKAQGTGQWECKTLNWQAE
ncbi:type II secretion system protein K [Desulfosarcina ovata subsp. sediminis]|uniref:Type II secretion system protein K n=1 Tax=Desulfosarcina ovata subsp. sediminis TaxID=885957 RepID=A0A5K7ZQX9_9BACT|nr:general secretion pathway protein GspK [Desulfosarcina ovata]BBO80153.1 type II secretion system protein K [Desulfosarcina ovata subsp. sediminis]